MTVIELMELIKHIKHLQDELEQAHADNQDFRSDAKIDQLQRLIAIYGSTKIE